MLTLLRNSISVLFWSIVSTSYGKHVRSKPVPPPPPPECPKSPDGRADYTLCSDGVYRKEVISKLVVGQKVTLSDAPPGGGTTGEVTETTKWHVAVVVDARREGKDGAYCVLFDNDNNVYMFYDWTDGPGWDVSWAIECPVPNLKILNSCD